MVSAARMSGFSFTRNDGGNVHEIKLRLLSFAKSEPRVSQ